MRNKEYSKELATVVKTFLEEDEWRYSFDEKTGIFDFALRTSSKIQKINYLIDVHEDEILVYGICPIGVEQKDHAMMAQMAEFMCRANYGLKNGCFELDHRDGEIRYKCYINCRSIVPSVEIIADSVHCIVAMYRHYSPGIVDIIFNGCSAKIAIDKCEKKPADELRSIVSEVTGENLEGASVEDLISRLSAHLESKEDSEDGTAQALIDESGNQTEEVA